jgi:alpha-acetolactate decarboxylase
MAAHSRSVRALALLAGVAVASWVAAQVVGPAGVQAFGSFKRLAHTGDTAAKIALREVPATAGTYAVGALTGLRGEVLLWDGKLSVTRGHSPEGRTEAAVADDSATLLALAQVRAWDEVVVPADMKQPEFEAFVVKQAAARGLNSAEPFPFLVRGEFPAVLWHVVTGAAGSGHGDAGAHGGTHAQGHARNRVFDERNAAGVILGFYSGDALEGVISHPGERFHVHYAARDFSRSGHVDGYTVRGGAVLSLPRQ